MTVIGIRAPGGPEVLVPQTRPLPQPGAGEVLIKVAAAGVNRPDVMQRQGLYPPPPGASDIPGPRGRRRGRGARRRRDALAGRRPGDWRWSPAAATPNTASRRERTACRCPPASTLIEAAALPETFFTVWHNVFERGALEAGETLLVHGGSSGIGTTAIQLGWRSARMSSPPPAATRNARPA